MACTVIYHSFRVCEGDTVLVVASRKEYLGRVVKVSDLTIGVDNGHHVVYVLKSKISQLRFIALSEEHCKTEDELGVVPECQQPQRT